MNLATRYLENAHAQVLAAEKLSMGDEIEALDFLGPSLLLLGFGVELYLKSLLLGKGHSPETLSRSPFGHDIWAMWTRDELKDDRSFALKIRDLSHDDLLKSYISPQSKVFTDPDYLPNVYRDVPEPETFEVHLEHVSRLHSKCLNFALRYPTDLTHVPEPMLLIRTFVNLIHFRRQSPSEEAEDFVREISGENE